MVKMKRGRGVSDNKYSYLFEDDVADGSPRPRRAAKSSMDRCASNHYLPRMDHGGIKHTCNSLELVSEGALIAYG
ncbi:hypothetical protein TorRG33x02_064170 [Trema orientale]|uniref:Uncharacterized protein n=1 Tax=Trema orientale TaxID=63057 RepID=A0A2P5FJ77_TREOI|nr:hypothetical protein TorRG33x02_064170 [Trema orientale]